ncbi:MAG: hypothetical protein HGA27_07655 [Peptococcaceae bacterium]|nr:hypothetical protein [Peptococcaceae bacterium]
MKKFTPLQKVLGIFAGVILVFMFVSFPAKTTQIDPKTKLETKVPDYKTTSIRAAAVVLATSIVIAFADKTTFDQKKSKSGSKNRRRNIRR